MKNYFALTLFLLTLQVFAQNDIKTKFQKNRYDLGISYYKKSDFVKAIDLFSLASKINPETEIGLESKQIVDTLKILLRKELTDKLIGTWRKTGDEPSWTTKDKEKANMKEFDEIMDINNGQILFYEESKKTRERKLIKSEDLVFYDKEDLNSLFSEVILSDRSIWSYLLDSTAKTLRVVNVGKETEDGVDEIVSDNPEIYYARII